MTDPVIAIEPEAPLGGGGEGGGSGGSGGIEIGEELALLQGGSTSDIYVDREYIYVPSGASGYVDEFIGQIDRYQDLWYILQDVNYNVIALTDSGGEVVRQHTFDPYGEVLTVEDFDAHPGIKIGHQGLFFDRLEPSAPILGAVSMGAAPQLQPGVFGLYQARNRVLLPRYGRWAQKDSNASGMLHTSLWHDGESPIPELAARSLQGVTTDGLNLFAFVGNSPFLTTDPLGLDFSLPSLLANSKVQSGIRAGSRAQTAYESIGTARDVLGALAGGASLQQVLLSSAFELVFDKFGGKVVDRVTGGSLTKRLSSAAGKAISANLEKAHKHHVFPQFRRDFFEGKGIKDIDEFCVPVLKDAHLRGIHGNGAPDIDPQLVGKWNAEWKDWIADNGDASTSDVYLQGLKMMEKCGLADLPLVPYK